jgi:SAM-dependent methyltransferase
MDTDMKKTDRRPTIVDVEKFWSSRPCNIRHSNKEIGTLDYFEEVEDKKLKVEPHIVDFSEFNRWRDKKVLEIGCGIGTMATLFAKHGANYTGVELSEASLDLTRKRFEIYGLNGKFYLGNAEELSEFLPQEKYDLIYSFGVIHHSPNPNRILEQAKKYMNDDTILKVMVYSKNSWKDCMIENGFDQPEAQYGCPIANTYTEDDIKNLFEGFEILSLNQDHIFPYQITEYKTNQYLKQPWFESMPEKMFRALEKRFGWHMLINAKLKKG